MARRRPTEVGEIAGRERVLAYAPTVDGSYVVATLHALHLPAEAGLGRLPWDQVVRASWIPPLLDLTVQAAPGARPRELQLELQQDGGLPPVLRERVEWSIIGEQHVPLAGEAGVRLVARRTEHDDVRWSVVFDAGLDAGDPDLRARADEALAALRSAWGV